MVIFHGGLLVITRWQLESTIEFQLGSIQFQYPCHRDKHHRTKYMMGLAKRRVNGGQFLFIDLAGSEMMG